MEVAEKVILTNMCMIYDNENHILVQERNKKTWPGLTFPGGHVEKDESFVKSTIREIKEETGLTINSMQLCGICQWVPLMGVRYIVLLFKSNDFQGELTSSQEGRVFWINRDDLKNYKLSDDFLEMYEVMNNPTLSEFFVLKDDEEHDIERKLL